MHILAFSG